MAAAASFAAASKAAAGLPLHPQLPLIRCRRHVSRRSPTVAAAAAAVFALEPLADPNSTVNENEVVEMQKWKIMKSKELGITRSMLNKSTRKVLSNLRKKGYDVYLVGGCVRDLIMKRTPKDFDIITSADLREVQKEFSRCDIVGRRFPICHVHVNNTIVEVSSFNTIGRHPCTDVRNVSRPPGCSENDYIRWRDCLRRDFTINGLMFDPYANEIYDYMGGMEDIKNNKVRTISPADNSFQEDCARILRAIRIAARLGFRVEKGTAQSIKDLAKSVLRLDKSRLLMEVNYMLAYGSGEASLRLLWRFGLLELLLPIQAAYFISQGFTRRDKGSNMLLSIFANLDRLVAPDRPCHSSLWVSLLAFHQALVREPRHPLVVAALTIAVHNGGDLSDAIIRAMRITHQYDDSFLELSDSLEFDTYKELKNEVLRLSSSIYSSLSSMTDEYFISQALAKYPQAPKSDLVLVPLQLYLKVCSIFRCLGGGSKERDFKTKEGTRINYVDLSKGELSELRHVFARVVFDTVFPPNLEVQNHRGIEFEQF